jgi:hypothetical protein
MLPHTDPEAEKCLHYIKTIDRSILFTAAIITLGTILRDRHIMQRLDRLESQQEGKEL